MERLDLGRFYASIQSVQGGPGRPASDPAVLLGLWVYATVEGVGSARKLARLCQQHDGFRWLCGGVPVDYHLLSDFRREQREALDELLTQIVGVLMAEELVEWKEDGDYDRTGLFAESKEILDVKIPFIRIPVRPGRNIAIIVEVAALNHRLRELGLHPADELNKRILAAMEATL